MSFFRSRIILKTVLIAFGTRPEAIKMCPVIKSLKNIERINVKILVTGQHKTMLYEVLESAGIVADYDLAIMKEGQTLSYVTSKVLYKTEAVIKELLPDAVLVHGDTSSAFAVALCAFYMGIKIFHIEAGLRTYDMLNPFPEEFNRRAISLICDYHFAPTEEARLNLINEGVKEKNIFITGNTAIDALVENIRSDFSHPLISENEKIIIITIHRRENQNDFLREIFYAVKQVAKKHKNVKIIYPMHKNEKIRRIAKSIFSDVKNVHLTEPLSPFVFHNFLNNSYFVITDSGGIQEEVSFLGKPIILVRKCTERKELLSYKCLKVIYDPEQIVCEADKLLLNSQYYKNSSVSVKIFGEGDAALKMADVIKKILVPE